MSWNVFIEMLLIEMVVIRVKTIKNNHFFLKEQNVPECPENMDNAPKNGTKSLGHCLYLCRN